MEGCRDGWDGGWGTVDKMLVKLVSSGSADSETRMLYIIQTLVQSLYFDAFVNANRDLACLDGWTP